MCHKLLFLFATWCTVSSSIIELNETTLESLPPLFALDDWFACQQDGDVYCTVKAALVSTEKNELLELLQAYSKQTLKHFNRTLTYRGVCVSRCGSNSSGSWHDAAQVCLDESLQQYGLQSQILSVDYCTGSQPPPSDASRVLAIVCVILISLVCLATGVHVLADKCATSDCNKYLLAFSLKKNWSILTLDRCNSGSDERIKDLACIEGIRVLGMQCVIFSHVLLLFIISFIDNPQYIEKMYDQFGWQSILNSPLWLQAFFSLSGFLMAYSSLIYSEKRRLTVFKSVINIAYRWVRLTPAAVFCLWFVIAWYPRLGSGPQWGALVVRESRDCAERWWYHALYIHNHLPLGKMCMGHTWYLAVDMQLHVVGLALMVVCLRWRRALPALLAVLAIASVLAAGVVVYLYQLTPIITAQSPQSVYDYFQDSLVMSLLYLPSWTNLTGYLGGIATAFILYHNQTYHIKLADNKLFNLVFHLSLLLGGCVVLPGVVFLSDAPPPAWAVALYSALDRTLVAVCFNVFLLGCFSKCPSAIREIFELRFFHVLGRLSYCVYLIHFIVMRLTMAGNTQLAHASIYNFLSVLITVTVLSYVAAIALCLLVELPCVEMWKAFFNASDRPRPSAPEPPRALPIQDVVKPFDLVANIRRRIEV